MTSKTTSMFSSEVRARAVRMVLHHEAQHASRWATILSITAKIGPTGQTLTKWPKQAERGTSRRPGPINGIAFQAYVDQELVPDLLPGDVLVMDNLGSRNRPGIRINCRAACGNAR